MADERLGHAALAAKPIPRHDIETWWAGAWLAAWQRCGNTVGIDGELLGFIFDRNPTNSHEHYARRRRHDRKLYQSLWQWTG